MATSPAEAMQDAATPVREVEFACSDCGETWTVHVLDGEDVTDKQAECPDSHCDGSGEEL